MLYALVVVLGAACGVLLTWYLLFPIVALLALTIGVVGVIEGQSLYDIVTDAAGLLTALQASWLASVITTSRLAERKTTPFKRTDRSGDQGWGAKGQREAHSQDAGSRSGLRDLLL